MKCENQSNMIKKVIINSRYGVISIPWCFIIQSYFSFFQLTYFWKGNCQDSIFKLSRCSTFGYTVHKRDPTIISHEPHSFLMYPSFLVSSSFPFPTLIMRKLSLRLNSIFSLSIPGKSVVTLPYQLLLQRRQMGTRLFGYLTNYPTSWKS